MKKCKFLICIVLLLALVGCLEPNSKPQTGKTTTGNNKIAESNISAEKNSSTENKNAADFMSASPAKKPPEPEIITPAEPEVKNIRITAVGDLMVHEWQIDEAYNKESGIYDFSHNFEMVSKYLMPADLTIGNLETVFAGANSKYTGYPTFNTPDSFGQAIKDAGFDLLTTANNHSLDRKEAGVLRTLDILGGLEIDNVGTYKDKASRDSVLIKDINGIKIAFLSFTYGTNGIPVPSGKDYLVNVLSEELIKKDITKAKELSPDLIIVMPHLGNEYELYPKEIFKNWVSMMFKYGADIVLASHPHVLQPMESQTVTDINGDTRKCFVIYSLGNFISSQRTEPRDAGVILNLDIEKKEKAYLKQVTFIPTWVQFKNTNNKYYIRILSVYDALTDYGKGIDNELRTADIKRLKAVHSETTERLLGEKIPIEEIQNEYTFLNVNENEL